MATPDIWYANPEAPLESQKRVKAGLPDILEDMQFPLDR
jgi:hypothetical protein